MKMQKTYHAKSWSKQAQEMCNNQIKMVKAGYIAKEEAIRFFANSYRHPLIRQRAAKSFGKKMRKES